LKKENKKRKMVHRIEVDCIFRTLNSSNTRAFVTFGNKEAFNILMNKLDKLGLGDQCGKLVFEFSSINRRFICNCGHNRWVHFSEKRYGGICRVEGCKCCKFESKNKGGKNVCNKNDTSRSGQDRRFKEH
jgi:hypothetical protein